MLTCYRTLLVVVPFLLSGLAYAADADDDESVIEEVIVTSSRIGATSGGAQDLSFVRSQIASGRIPHPDGITAEGLFSEYDLTLTSDISCDQLFCLFHEAIESNLVTKPAESSLIGLGFATNIEAAGWQLSLPLSTSLAQWMGNHWQRLRKHSGRSQTK